MTLRRTYTTFIFLCSSGFLKIKMLKNEKLWMEKLETLKFSSFVQKMLQIWMYIPAQKKKKKKKKKLE